MDDPTNQYTGSPPQDSTRTFAAPHASGSLAIGQPRVIDEAAWLAACQAAFPWQPLARIAAGKTSPLLWGDSQLATPDTVQLLTKLQRALQSSHWKKDLAQALDWFLKDAAIVAA